MIDGNSADFAGLRRSKAGLNDCANIRLAAAVFPWNVTDDEFGPLQ